jgi:leukotriene-A4 hydrolase
MENPRLTFASPSILAGDRSLTSLIAHELAHSWSGNLVTNGTWNDFWLNEGFTVYFEHRIMEKLYGRDYAEMLALLSLQDLRETIQSLKDENLYADTKLKLDLAGRNPDDGVTDIAYNKGYFFLRLFEERYGRERFDSFLKHYFSSNAFKSLGTQNFIDDITTYYQDSFKISLNDTLFNQWILSEGLPADCPVPRSDRFDNVEAFIAGWKHGDQLSEKISQDWSTHEWLHFLKNLPDPLTPSQMSALDAFGHFTASGNAEIATQWLVKVIRYQYAPAYMKLEEFLIHTGRRKFLVPLYTELLETEEGRNRAVEIYSKARPNYHFVATNTFDKIVK